MLRDNRVLFRKSGVFSDLSNKLSNIHSGTEVINFASGDYLYLGSSLPFNHRYFEISVANAVVASPTIEYWKGGGSGWEPVVDVLDYTKSAAGASLAQDGIISWEFDPNDDAWSWDDTEDMTDSGLEDQKIYGLYWVRISWSATLTGTTALSYVGHKFAEDEALEAEYPDLSRAALKTGWETGKTDWKEQMLLASEYIVADLIGVKRKIVSPNQILKWELFEKACVQRAAMIIYKGLGEDYAHELGEAKKAYAAAIDVRNFQVDENRNGKLDAPERESRVEWLSR